MNETNVKLNNVRLSFPYLWEPTKGPDGNSTPAYAAAFLLDKTRNAADIANVRKVIAEIVRTDFKGKTPPKTCLREGSEKPDVDGYGDTTLFINARNSKRPHVVNRDLTPLTAEDGKPYAGCYVNATLRLWAQDNKYGKRINAQLRTVQFVKDGEPFGEGSIDVSKELEALPDDGGDVV